jgi:hypothetical protein
MNMRLLGELAASQAENLVKEWGIPSLPVDPFVVARKHEIEVVPKPNSAPGVFGCLLRQGEAFTILYATHIENDGFKNFTVAHELGHYFLPGHPETLFPSGIGLHQSKSGFTSDEESEWEADFFAAAMLMPEHLFVEAMRECEPGFSAVEELANTCRTSITATAIRYATFAEDAVAVIMSSGRKIDWCFLSPPLRELRGVSWIRKGEILPTQCETTKFNSDSVNVSTGDRVVGSSRLDLWLDGAPKIEMEEDVVGLGRYGKTLTVLFTTEALDDEGDDLDGDDD